MAPQQLHYAPSTMMHFPSRRETRRRQGSHHYFSRHRYTNPRRTGQLLKIDRELYSGISSPWAWVWGLLFLFAPTAYLYIALVLVRELFREHLVRFGQAYLPLLEQWTLASAILREATIITTSPDAAGSMIVPQPTHEPYQNPEDFSSLLLETVASHPAGITIERTPRQWLWFWIEVGCYLEAIFYVLLKIRVARLQWQDPLEASLTAAPLMEIHERADLWHRMMDAETGTVTRHISGWFFDGNVQNITDYDIRDFIAWSMFEGRHQEHLTEAELEQLEDFVEELQYHISLELYGASLSEGGTPSPALDVGSTDDVRPRVPPDDSVGNIPKWRRQLPVPKKAFHFKPETLHEEEAKNFFSNLFESYSERYDRMEFSPVKDFTSMMQKAAGDHFHPVQDLRKMVAETAQNIAETDAMATASQRATQMYETLVPTGSIVDKQLSAVSHATYQQLIQAWDSVKIMNQKRLETARFLRKQRQRLEQQLKGYQLMLNRMRDLSSGVPSYQMATLMRRITECYEDMQRLERRAQTAFVQLTGFALKNLSLFQPSEPQRYAKYSSDPIMSMVTYPLSFHILLLGGTEIPLRFMMMRRGFQRLRIGPVSYYYHPGNEDEDECKSAVVFVHGIGIGLIPYMPLIDALLESGRPIFMPEIPYVSGFRPWQSSKSVLPPAVVSSTMVAMLATHGKLCATWVGHSYGTSWLSYMVKYAPESVATVMFLDPICFCLYSPFLTKQFVYTKPDPGTISYIIRTDVIVKRTIQRSFPWARIVLFAEQIRVPCHIFLSEKDALVPSEKVEQYLRTKHVPIQDFDSLCQNIEQQSLDVDDSESDGSYSSTSIPLTDDRNDCSPQFPRIECTIFRGDGHGEWTEKPRTCTRPIACAIERLCQRADRILERERS